VYAHAALVAAPLALAGLACGYPQRALIARYVPDGAGDAHGPVAGPLAVGLVTAVLLAALGARVHPPLALAAACALTLCTVPLAFIDAAVKRLPDLLTGAAYAAAGLFLILAAAVSGHWGDLARAALGGLVLAAVYLILLLISPSGMGLGDVKLAASLGTMLAWTNWDLLLFGGFAGFALAAIYSVALLATGRATRKQQIPFGPFMIAGAFLAVLVG
jgi:leader peptidase (prepilin peptidase) / N-methyltransferase